MGDVRQLYTKTEAGTEEPVITSIDVGFSLTIGDKRALTFRTMIDRSLPLDEQRQIVRDMLALGDVEKAKYELDDLLAEQVVRETALRHAQDNVKNVSSKYEDRRKQIAALIVGFQAEAGETHQRHERDFRASGRSGNFKPSSAQTQEITGISREIEKLEAERTKMDEDEKGERQNCLTLLASARRDLGTCKEEIAKRRHVLGLPQAE